MSVTGLVSVLLPVHNGGEYLSATITSILSQDADLELLVQDDVSTDATAEVCRSFSDSRIRYQLNNENLGCFGSLQAAVDRAIGSIVRVFSHDDLMLPGDVAESARVLCESDCGAVITQFQKINSSGDVYGDSLAEAKIVGDLPFVIRGEQAAATLFHRGCVSGTQSNITCTREAIQQVCFATWMRFVGDFSLLAGLAINHGLLVSPLMLTQVRFHPMQLSLSGRSPAKLISRQGEVLHVTDMLLESMDPTDRAFARKQFKWIYGYQLIHQATKAVAHGSFRPMCHLVRALGPREAAASAYAWVRSGNGRIINQLRAPYQRLRSTSLCESTATHI